ncbi:hypothetical protein D3C75_746460 [compost metagenome]
MPLKPPPYQKATCCATEKKILIPSLRAVSIAEMAAPANTSRIGVMPRLLNKPTLKTKPAPNPAPRIQSQSVPVNEIVGRKTIAITSVTPAPAFNPRIPESAKGLRLIP